ncbi:MAG: HD domain-containing protein [Candidatus Dormibacteraeota bacterium]|nr:HD domain-containing protein [Candidatus Dormibacteraeota bacterium]
MPEVDLIVDRELRDKVLQAWAAALAESSFRSLEEVPGEPEIDPSVNQLSHQRAVARLSWQIADVMEASHPQVHLDRDVLIAGALVHDLGKAYEYDPARAQAWRADPRRAGYPPVRHPAYGVHLALQAGLPEAVAHICAAHSREGDSVERSLEAVVVHHADFAYWEIVAKARTGLSVEEVTRMALPADGLRAAPERFVGSPPASGSER